MTWRLGWRMGLSQRRFWISWSERGCLHLTPASSPEPGGDACRGYTARARSLARAGGADFVADVLGVLLEVLLEKLRQMRRLAVIGVLVVPGAARVEHLGGHVGDADRHLQAEDWILAELALPQRAVERGVDHGAGVGDLDPRTGPVWAAGPAGVDQPDAGLMALNLLAQQVTVARRRQGHEGRAEAGRERRLRLGQAALGAGHLGGVAEQEVVGRLGGRQARDRRQYAEGVGCQEHDRARVPGAAGLGGVGDHPDWVSSARVLGQRGVVVVDLAGV